MRIADFIRIHKEMMNLLSEYGIKMDDFKYVDLFADYDRMAKEGYKVSYIVIWLADKYGLSEASVYRILRKFKVAI